MSTDLVVWISPFSPLLTYSSGWQQATSGTAQCGGTGDFGVQVNQLYCKSVERGATPRVHCTVCTVCTVCTCTCTCLYSSEYYEYSDCSVAWRGATTCPRRSTIADNVTQVTEFIWYWQSSSGYTISAGLDGSLQTGTAGAQAATLSSSAGDHSARLEVECDNCGSTTFALSGAQLTSTSAG